MTKPIRWPFHLVQQKFGAAFHYFSAQRFLTRSNLSLHKQFAEKGTISWNPATYKGWWRMPVRVRPSKLLKVYLLPWARDPGSAGAGSWSWGMLYLLLGKRPDFASTPLVTPLPHWDASSSCVAREKTPTRRDLVTTWIESDEGSKVTEQRTQQNSWIA